MKKNLGLMISKTRRTEISGKRRGTVRGGGGNPKLITNCEEVRNDHALQHAVPESEGRAFHQMEKVLHQNRKATQSTAVKHS